MRTFLLYIRYTISTYKIIYVKAFTKFIKFLDKSIYKIKNIIFIFLPLGNKVKKTLTIVK